MPKKFPGEFERDVVAVAGRGDLTIAEVAAISMSLRVRYGARLGARRGAPADPRGGATRARTPGHASSKVELAARADQTSTDTNRSRT